MGGHARAVKQNSGARFGVWHVIVYDNLGWVYMTHLVDGEWKICTFDSREEAERAAEDYNEFWKGAE